MAKDLDVAYPDCLDVGRSPSDLVKTVIENKTPVAVMPFGFHDGFGSFIIYGYDESEIVRSSFTSEYIFSKNQINIVYFDLYDTCDRYGDQVKEFAVLYNERAARNLKASKRF